MPLTCKDEDEDPFARTVREIQQGVRLEENYRRLDQCFRPGLLRYFTYRKFETNAEDLCQEVLIKVHEGIHGFAGRSRFSCWVYRIAHNVLVGISRRLDENHE